MFYSLLNKINHLLINKNGCPKLCLRYCGEELKVEFFDISPYWKPAGNGASVPFAQVFLLGHKK